jgi:DNA-binding XRE family transcriptional regulator
MPKTLVKLEETSTNKELDLAYNITHKIYTKLRQFFIRRSKNG